MIIGLLKNHEKGREKSGFQRVARQVLEAMFVKKGAGRGGATVMSTLRWYNNS